MGEGGGRLGFWEPLHRYNPRRTEGFVASSRYIGLYKDNMGWSGWEEFGNLTPNEKTNLREK